VRAITQDRYGWDAVRLAEVPDPVPGAGEVLVRVRAAAVNPYDWHYLAGTPGIARLGMVSKAGFAGPLGDMVLGKLLGPRLGVRVARFDGVADADDLALLAGLVADGTVRVEVSRTYPLEEAVEAVRQVAGRGHTRGKIVVVP
jgi:NADPH:quinone reductase-like Zn-dependent oxidoreductase